MTAPDRLEVAIDCNAADQLVLPGALELVEAAVAAGHLSMKIIHIQEDEIQAIPQPGKRAALTKLLAHVDQIPSSLFVFGVSKLEEARLGETPDHWSDADGSPRPVDSDDMLLHTCMTDGWTLVTSDRGLRRKAKEEGVPTLHGWEVLAIMYQRLDWTPEGRAT